jgi:hypothetical protein
MTRACLYFFPCALVLVSTGCPQPVDDRPCRTFEGDLTVEDAPGLDEISDVCTVTGDLIFGGSDSVFSLAQGLFEVNLPRLETVDGSLVIQSNQNLSAIVLPALTTVGGDFLIRTNPTLGSLEFSSLTTVGGIFAITDSGFALQRNSPEEGVTFSFPELIAASGGAVISGNDVMSSFSAPNLTILDGDLGFASFSLFDNPTLVTVELGSLLLIGGDLRVINNEELSGLALPALSSVATNYPVDPAESNAFIVADNAALRSISTPLLSDIGGTVDISGNSSLASCSGALIDTVGDCAN